jgi:hypothetical protein
VERDAEKVPPSLCKTKNGWQEMSGIYGEGS